MTLAESQKPLVAYLPPEHRPTCTFHPHPQGLTAANALERNTFNNGIVSMNGSRAQANNYTLDGTTLVHTFSPTAVNEVRTGFLRGR